MRIRLSVTLTLTSFVAFVAAQPGAAGELPAVRPPLAAVAPAASVCSAVPGALSFVPSPKPADSCNFCGGEDFCPQEGVRCSYAGTCTTGHDRCCNYTCVCDASCTSVSQLGQACAFQVPICPPICPPRTLCQISYCGSEGIRCVFNNTCGTGGCCNYDCGPDATCILPDPLPVNAC
jgi:hypothetical protein